MHYTYTYIVYVYSRNGKTYLDEHGEVDDGDGGGDEHGLQRHDSRVYEEHQGERHGAAQTAVGHDEFLHFVQFVQPELVRQRRQHYHACNGGGSRAQLYSCNIAETLFRAILRRDNKEREKKSSRGWESAYRITIVFLLPRFIGYFLVSRKSMRYTPRFDI